MFRPSNEKKRMRKIEELAFEAGNLAPKDKVDWRSLLEVIPLLSLIFDLPPLSPNFDSSNVVFEPWPLTPDFKFLILDFWSLTFASEFSNVVSETLTLTSNFCPWTLTSNVVFESWFQTSDLLFLYTYTLSQTKDSILLNPNVRFLSLTLDLWPATFVPDLWTLIPDSWVWTCDLQSWTFDL